LLGGLLALGAGCKNGASHLTADAAPEAIAEVAAPEVIAEVAAPEATVETAPEVDPACQTIASNTTRMVNLRITADNECEVFVNGTSVGMTTSWSSPVTIDVSLFVHPGKRNVIAVRGTNTSSQGGNDRGILGHLIELGDGGNPSLLVTDDQWKMSRTEETGWTALDFDDSAWPAATVVGNHGDPPWGALLGASPAKWIWSAPIPVDTADKPNLETAYVRRVFYFGTDGTSIASTPACPAVTNVE
jgi:hypothetical protein